MRHIISVLIDNEAGALVRMAGLLAARGYNIDSLTVAPSGDPLVSRATIVTIGDEIEQVLKQLSRLVEIIAVEELTERMHIEREIMLVKVRADGVLREEFKRLCDIFRARILGVTDQTYIIEITGGGEKLNSFLEVAGKENLIEVVRSGALSISRADMPLCQ